MGHGQNFLCHPLATRYNAEFRQPIFKAGAVPPLVKPMIEGSGAAEEAANAILYVYTARQLTVALRLWLRANSRPNTVYFVYL